MKEYVIAEKSELTAIAEAIRERSGSTETYSLTEMATAVSAIVGDSTNVEKYLGEITAEQGSYAEIGATLNIAYGDTAPEDHTKLWIKCEKPAEVVVNSDISVKETSVETAIGALPKAAYGMASAKVGTKIYLFGGRQFTKQDCYDINVFDTETNSTTSLEARLPTAASQIAAAAVGTKIFLFGGNSANSTDLDTISIFDTETSKITTITKKLPKAAYGIAAAAVGTKIYLFGGRGQSKLLSNINLFDTETNNITTLSATLPTSAHDIGIAAVGTKIYLFGGNNVPHLSTINVFDTETNNITTLSDTLPYNTYGIATAAAGTKVYLFGGKNSSNTDLRAINVFDTETNSLTTLSTELPIAAHDIAATAIGTKIYLFGGRCDDTDIATINKFTVVATLATNCALLQTTTQKNFFNILTSTTATVKVGVENVYLGNTSGYAEKIPAALYHDGDWLEI
jgi:N-acetylneuraminic acid mutarotase